MEIIVLSAPEPLMGEFDTMDWLIEQGIDRYHVRKPEGTFEQTRNALNRVPKDFRANTSVHAFHDELKTTYTPCGIHHTSNSNYNPLFEGTQSKSFHSIQEIKSNTLPYHYGFLSPVFPSISKKGYEGNFTEKELQELNETNPFPLYALGGISAETVLNAKQLGFAGVVLFGTIWEEVRWTKMEDNFKRIKDLIGS